MIKCAWCREEREQPDIWSKNKEPICARCVGKYRYAIEIGAAKGKLEELTKEERRKVSRELNDLEIFHAAMASVQKQEISGVVKGTAYLVVGILLIALITLFIKLTDYFGERSWLAYLIPIGIGFYLVILATRFSWLFKLWQMFRKMQKGGYRING